MIEIINTILLVILTVWVYKMSIAKKNDVHFYVARDKTGSLYLYMGKPLRGNICWQPCEDCHMLGNCDCFQKYDLRPEDFKDLKWEDEPQEVFVTVKN